MEKQMSEAAKKARRMASKKWRDKNKDKIAEYNVKYWERKAEQMGLASEQAEG